MRVRVRLGIWKEGGGIPRDVDFELTDKKAAYLCFYS